MSTPSPLKAFINIHDNSGERLVSDGQIYDQLRESCILSAGSCMLRQADITVTEAKVRTGNSVIEERCARQNCGLITDTMHGGLSDLVDVQRLIKQEHPLKHA